VTQLDEHAQLVSCSVSDAVALVRFERAERRNAWNTSMQAAYRAALARCERDPQIRAVVVTGAGDTFSVGGDVEVLRSLGESGSWHPAIADPSADAILGNDLGSFGFVCAMSKPVIAAINGAAAGNGFTLACFCDLRVAVSGAKLTTASSRLGLPAEHGVSWILPRIVGAGRALELLVLSPVLSAEDALAIGLVNRVVPRAELLDSALQLARRLADEISPASVRMMKGQLLADERRSLAESVSAATALVTEALTSADYREGVAAFLERRPPSFQAVE
jgi:enoyl-CoA hydratase/carnithine racemase